MKESCQTRKYFVSDKKDSCLTGNWTAQEPNLGARGVEGAHARMSDMKVSCQTRNDFMIIIYVRQERTEPGRSRLVHCPLRHDDLMRKRDR